MDLLKWKRKDLSISRQIEQPEDRGSLFSIEDSESVPPDMLAPFAENASYYKSIQSAKIPGFRFGYFTVRRGGLRVCVVPYFVMNFKLNTMLPDFFLKKYSDWIQLKLACVGSPVCDIGRMDGLVTEEVLELVNQQLKNKSKLIAYKGFSSNLPLKGFVCVRGLPVAVLKTNGHFWKNIRSDRRAKLLTRLKKASSLRVVECSSLSNEQVARVHQLYLNTYNKAQVKFEKINIEYFKNSSPLSRFLLFYENQTIVGFCELIINKPYAVLRYLGLDYEVSRKYELYFNLFLRSIEVMEREGCSEIDFGATSYDFKMKLGSQLHETSVYYQHSNKFVHWCLKNLKTLLEPSESELR